MGTQADMIQAVNNIEAAAVALADAYNRYTTAYRVASSTLYAQTPSPREREAVSELEHSCGPHLVAQGAHGRLLTLGAAGVFAPLSPMSMGPEWTAPLIDKIEHHVPEEAAVASRAG